MSTEIQRDVVVENEIEARKYLLGNSPANTNYEPEQGTVEWNRLHPYESGILKRPVESEQTVQEEVPKKRGRPKKNENALKARDVPFDEVADKILEEYSIITMDDTKEIFIYDNGIFKLKGANTEIELAIRDVYKKLFIFTNEEFLNLVGEDFHIPTPKMNYVSEVVNYIKIHTTVFRDDLDKIYTNLINLKNGMFDIDSWKLIPHDPKYKSIRQIPITYDPTAKCPQIEKFLSEVVSSNDVVTLTEFLGYCLIPDVRMQKSVMLYGSGSNGKSIFLKLATKFIGDENVSGVSLQLLQTDRFRVANLYGKLLNIYPDLNDQTIYQNDIFKILNGDDRFDAEKKYLPSFSFYNKARLMFSANKIPRIKNDDDEAYFRRWILINFPNQFTDEPNGKKIDKNLFPKLTTEEELSGFLNNALAGLKKVLSNGIKLTYDQTTESVSRTYRLNSSSAAAFAETCLEASSSNTSKDYIYKVYVAWAEAKRIKPLANNAFGKEFKNILNFEGDREMHTIDVDGTKISTRITVWCNTVVNEVKFKLDTGIPLSEALKQEW